MTIYPALLSDSQHVLQSQLDRLAGIEVITGVQVDIIDGIFADNLTITPADLPELNFGGLTIDIHLMVDEPLDYVFELKDYDQILNVRAVLGQIEKMTDQENFLEEVKKNNWRPGLSLDVYTPISAIDRSAWPKVETLQLMSIESGFQGQTFKPQVLRKVAEARQQADSHLLSNFEILLDGGVNETSIEQIKQHAVDGVAVGSALWNSEEISDTIDQLRHAQQRS